MCIRDSYGTDKPDLRFGMELVDLSDLVVGGSFKAVSYTHLDVYKRQLLNLVMSIYMFEH